MGFHAGLLNFLKCKGTLVHYSIPRPLAPGNPLYWPLTCEMLVDRSIMVFCKTAESAPLTLSIYCIYSGKKCSQSGFCVQRCAVCVGEHHESDSPSRERSNTFIELELSAWPFWTFSCMLTHILRFFFTASFTSDASGNRSASSLEEKVLYLGIVYWLLGPKKGDI